VREGQGSIEKEESVGARRVGGLEDAVLVGAFDMKDLP
jgi:hypothetical protein